MWDFESGLWLGFRKCRLHHISCCSNRAMRSFGYINAKKTKEEGDNAMPSVRICWEHKQFVSTLSPGLCWRVPTTGCEQGLFTFEHEFRPLRVPTPSGRVRTHVQSFMCANHLTGRCPAFWCKQTSHTHNSLQYADVFSRAYIVQRFRWHNDLCRHTQVHVTLLM